MKIVIIGQDQFGADILKELLLLNKNIVGISTPLPKQGNDTDKLSLLGKENNLPNIYTKLLKEKKYADEFITSWKPDLIIFAFVTDIVPKNILDSATIGAIQYHPSLLPKHRGRSAMNWAIVNGEKETGITIFWVDEGIDTGPILIQESVKINNDDSVSKIYFNNLYPLGIQLMIKAIKLVENNEAPKIIQDESLSTYEPPMTKKFGKIDWNQDAQLIHNLIRGCDPQPGAHTTFKEKPIQLYQSTLLKEKFATEQNGTITDIRKNAIIISTSTGSIQIKKIREEGQDKTDASSLFHIGDKLN
ncbi:MAG: methionyl-tRNA formyltransferase [Dehalococcoidia bacterium]|jgi:methionyl-tRNA formyltransferase|nr:MAG: methionyl-tRNA formyltransferase [Chloroflexota bacterium]|tara:strand:- start:683 stop:1591 length:909 start_codon:yes stop_codon:yes gene_type:complete